jgi:ribosomal protein S1
VRQVTDAVKTGQQVQVRVLSIEPENRRISLSIKRAVGAAAPSTASTPTPMSKTQSKKKRPPLRGGLDF